MDGAGVPAEAVATAGKTPVVAAETVPEAGATIAGATRAMGGGRG